MTKDVHRILGDRTFIAYDIARARIPEQWMSAVGEFGKNCDVEEFARQAYQIKDTPVKFALVDQPSST